MDERQEALIGIRTVLLGNTDKDCQFACGPHAEVLEGVDPRLRIDGVGSSKLKLPLQGKQLQRLEKVCEPAKFGRGTKTRTDTAVRNSLQLSAHKVQIYNAEWGAKLQKLIDTEVKKALGIEKVRREPDHAVGLLATLPSLNFTRTCNSSVAICMSCFVRHFPTEPVRSHTK